MTTLQVEDPTSFAALLEPAPPPARQIALHVTVTGRQGERAYWMTEGGELFFRRLTGALCRASQAQARRIMKGLELARHSAAFTVAGRVVEATELEIARGLRN